MTTTRTSTFALATTMAAVITCQAQAAELTSQASVIDGDTIEIHGERVRLQGIDAPESRQLCSLDGKRDRYGRLLAVCYLGCTDLNAWLVSEGWALAFRRYSTEYVARKTEHGWHEVGCGAGTSKRPGNGERDGNDLLTVSLVAARRYAVASATGADTDVP